jgi:hypothetical protein
MVSSTIESARIDHPNLGDFLEENQAMLKKVSQKYALKNTTYLQTNIDRSQWKPDTYFTYYDMINIYDDRNHFMKISTEFTKDLDIKREEIVTGGNRSVDKKTILSNDEITNKSQKEWLKEMFRNNSYQLFRAWSLFKLFSFLPRCDACNTSDEVQFCHSCNRLKCTACDNEIHSVSLP